MPFIKVQKTKAYFKRFQVKFRRRREGKTDYYARKRLVVQAKNKYESPRYRFVVRFTNKYVITQVVRAMIDGDRVMASAYSSELPRYGVKVGLKNYAAAYCTGLLCARRLLTKLDMAEIYPGNTETTGDVVKTIAPKHATERTVATKAFYVADVDDRRPFRALLDVGTRPTTLGARLFGALKGASDGGLDIPHKNTKFPGYDKEAKQFNAGVHKEKIFGGNISEYMTTLKESDAEAYASQFSQYIKEGVDADNIEDMYTAAHAAIRADPSPAAKKTRESNKAYKKPTRRSLEQRKDRVRQKKASRIFALQRDN